MERKSTFILNLKKGVLAAFAVMAALLISSCEIGLGASVDTERPKLEIKYPPKGAVIMDTFTLAGKISDDVGLNYIKVTLTNKDLKTTYTYSSKDGQVTYEDPGKNWKKGTTWTASLGKKTEGQTLYNGWDLPDGDYFIDVEANDGYGSVYDRRSVTIDNTPPVLLVENLISIEGNTNETSVFGHKINLTGQAKDESGLSKVLFSAYDESGNEVLSSKLDYEYTSNGVVLARYSATEPQDAVEKVLAENFNKIYGTDFNSGELQGERTRYLTVQISDTARVYNEPVFEALGEEAENSMGTGDGNLSTEIYLKTQEFKQEGISIDDLKNYKKQLTVNETLDAKLSLLSSTSIAAATYDGSTSNVTKFHINPKLEPIWYINNYEKKNGNPFETLYVGSPLTFHFEWGNNKEKFRPSNIKVVLARLNMNGDDIYDTVLSEDELKAVTESSDDAVVLIKEGDWSSDLTETFTKSVTVNDPFIHTPSSYKIFVFGHDGSGATGVKFEEKENNVYGFKAKKNTQAPKIVFLAANDETDENGNALPKDGSGIGPVNDTVPFWFKILTDGEKLLDLPEIEVKVGDTVSVLDNPATSFFKLEKNPDTLPENPGKEVDGDKEKLSYTFKWTLKKNAAVPLPTKDTNPIWNDEFDFNITVKATDMGGGEAKNNITFELDNKEPEVSIDTVAVPDMSKTGNKLNGTVEIPVSFTDNNPKQNAEGKNLASYKVYNKAKTTVLHEGTVENEKNIELDTTSYPEDICLVLSVTDKFGNTGKVEKEYKVDQNTDKPVLSFNNLKPGLNIFGIKTNNVIELSVSDDDESFGKIEVRVRPYDSADWTTEQWYTINTRKTVANWNFTKKLIEADADSALISADGKYKVQFRVTDSVGLATGVVLSDVYDVIADSTKPVFGTETVSNSVKEADEYFVKKATTAKISFEITEVNLKEVTVNGESITPTKVTGTEDKWNVSYDWDPGTKNSGLYELEFAAKDESENSSYKTVTIHYVKDLPVISDIEVTPELLSGNKVNGIISYKGSVDQSRNDTKIKKIILELKQGGTVKDSKEVTDSANFEWNDIDTTAFADDELTLEITATDIAGNSNVPEKFKVNVDQSTDTPVLKLNNLTSGENAFGFTSNNEIEISATDDDAGFGKFEVRVRDASVADWTTESWHVIETGKTEAVWNFTDVISAEGKYKVQFRGTDSVGLAHGVKESDDYVIIADSTNPEFGPETVTNGVLENSEYFVKKNTAAEISLNVTEANLKEVTVNGTQVAFTSEGVNISNVVYNWIPGSNASGIYDLVFAAKDKSGNVAAEKKVTIHYVNELPVISIIEITPEALTGSKVNGIISYKGNVDHDVRITSINLTLKQNDTAVAGYTKEITDSASFEWTGINTTLSAFVDNKPLILEIDATDIAGNKGSDSFTVNVDQSTDKPVISFEADKIDESLASFADVENPVKNPGSKKNLLGINDNSSFYVYVTDDDAVKTVSVQAFKADGTAVAAAKTYTADKLDAENKVLCDIGTDLGISAAGSYVIKVNAEDDKTKTGLTSANAADEKVIYIVVDGVAPEITNIKVDGKLYNGPVYINGKKTVSFDVTEMHLSSVTFNNTSVDLGEPDTSTGSKVYSYSIEYTPTKANETVVIKADDGTGLSASKEITINHDKTAPVINTPSVTPTVFNDGETLNEKITITGTVTDESGYDGVQGKVNDSDLVVKLQRCDNNVWTDISGATFTVKNQKYTLTDFDTATLKDKTDLTKAFKGEIRIYVKAKDRAGNDSGTTPTYFVYKVDQDSDKPSISFTNVNADATTAKENLFGFGKWTITGSVKDDDGTVKLYYKVGAGSYTEITNLSAIDSNNEQSFSFEVPHSAGQKGNQSVEFLCVDKNGASNSTTSNKTLKTILYAIDNQKPEFTARTLNGKAYETGLFAGKDRTIKLEASDDNGIAKVEYYTPASGETPESWNELSGSSGAYTHTISDATNGTVKNKYRVTDIYDRETETELEYEVDTTAPVNTGVEIKVAGKDYDSDTWLNSGSVNISITGVTDDNLTETVSYSVTGASSGSGNVQINSGVVSNILALSDGISEVTYTYSDKAGNTTPVKVTVNVDTAKPTATVTTVSGVRKSGALTLSFDASDGTGSGLAYAYIGTSSDFSLTNGIPLSTTTGEGDTAVTTYPVTKTGNTVDVTVPAVDGKYQYYVVLEDQAGNKSGYTGFGEFTIDGTDPFVKIDAVSDAESSTTDIIDVNKTITISGTAEDTHPSTAVPTLSVYAAGADGKKTGSAIPPSGLITEVSSPANTFASWAYNVDTTKLDDNKNYVFEVTATDSVGNPGSNSITLYVNQTSDRPVITLDNVKTDGTTTLSEGKIEWTASDDDDISTMAIKVMRKNGNDWEKVESSSDGFKTVTSSAGGKYSYDIPTYKDASNNDTADGSYKLYFKVTDAKATTFTTPDTETDALTEPRVYENGGDTSVGTSIAFDVDGTAPVIGTVQVQVRRDGSSRYTDSQTNFKSSIYYGGPNKRYIQLTIPVTDNVATGNDITVTVKVGAAEAERVSYSAANGFVKEIDFGAKNEDNSYKIPSGLVAIRIEAADKSGSSDQKYFNIYVDNLGPDEEGKAIQNMTPSEDTEVTASVSIAANIRDDETANSRVASVKYYVPRNNGIAAGETGSVIDTEPSENTPWSTTDLSFSDVVLKLELKGLATSEGHIETVYSGHTQTATNSGIYFLPVWFRLEDNCGNISYVEKTIRYNPDAVRPRIKQTFPLHNKTIGEGDAAKDYVVLGGTILLAGTAEDNVAVDAVYVQYDINGDGKYSKSDVAYLINAGYSVVKIEDGTVVTVTDSIFTNDDDCEKWGIKADGTNSWNTEFAASGLSSVGLEIGGKNEAGQPINPDNKTLNIRICARDKDTPTTHTSAWTEELHVSVNNSVPQFGRFYLVQYDNAGAELKRLPYENGMFISGSNWRLEGTVVDNDGISSVKSGATEITDKTSYTDDATEYTGFTVKVAVEPDANGRFSTVLTATDTANSGEGITTSQYVVNVDNTPPAFKDGADDGALVLYAGEYGKTKLDSVNRLQNSNGWTTIASKVSETGSGFARVVFFVERYSTKTVNGATATYTNRRFYNVKTGARIEASAVSFNSDGLPYVTKGISQVAGNSYQFTLSDSTWDENIREGGLVVIGNVYKTITEIDKVNKKVTVDDQILGGWTSGTQNAQFIYAFVVDHTGESTDTDGNIKNDDKDGLVESITKSVNEYTWDVSFDSSVIPDGPLTVNVVVFDVAGNSRHGTVVTRAANNAPRITSVKLGTDLNYNNSIQDTSTYSEYTQFYAITNSHGEADTTQGLEIWNLKPSEEIQSKDRDWVIKKDLSLKPEFVGGKAPFYYVFSKADAGLSEPASGTNLSSETSASGTQGKFAEHEPITVPNTYLNKDTGEDQVNTYRFTFWDSTEESTPGVNTGWCILNVELMQDLEDTHKPVAFVHPFFWKGRGTGNNSLAWDTTDVNKALGHIELEADWVPRKADGSAVGQNESAATSGVYDADPKVSGKIVIRGTAYDDTRLSKVVVTFEDIIADNVCYAEYNGSTWEDKTAANSGYSLSVTDQNGGVTQNGHLVEWALTIDTSKIEKDSVKETGLDKKVVVKAVDAASKTAASSDLESDPLANNAPTTTANTYYYATKDQASLGKYYDAVENVLEHVTDYKTSTADSQATIVNRIVEEIGIQKAAVEASGTTEAAPAVYKYKVYGTNSQYQMDIVPYVTDVITNLSAGKVNNPTVRSRTANGHYPVQSVVTNVAANMMTNSTSEDIVFRGFNLGGTLSVTAASTTNNIALAGASLSADSGLKKTGDLCFNAATLKSGKPIITVNNIPLMNNLNNNGAKGECSADSAEKEYDNCYNRTPNYENNINLTDDIEFDVWEFNDTIIKAVENKLIDGFAMQINQNNSKIQYAFGSQRYFVAANNENYSTRYKGSYNDYIVPSSIGFHVNETGARYYSTVLDGTDDTNFVMYSRNGTNTENNSTIEVHGTAAGIKDMIKSPAFASRTTTTGTGGNQTTTVNTYLAYYHKGNKTITLRRFSDSNEDIFVSAGNAGEYVSIAVTPTLDGNGNSTTNDTVCAVWCNTSGVQYKYKTTANGTGSWSDATSIFTGNGAHCQIVADGNGGIHIAAYVNGGLQYAYASSYSGTFNTCTVDSGNTGNNLKLDVALVKISGTTYRPIPVIGYYSGVAQRPKYAKLNTSEWLTTSNNSTTVKTAASFDPADGISADKFTGAWEINYVPTLKTLKITDDDKIYAGLWKYRYNDTAVTASGSTIPAGSIKTSDSSNNSTYSISSASNTDWTSNTYGNGTSNAVLCYIADGGKRIESAQMR